MSYAFSYIQDFLKYGSCSLAISLKLTLLGILIEMHKVRDAIACKELRQELLSTHDNEIVLKNDNEIDKMMLIVCTKSTYMINLNSRLQAFPL